MESLIKTIFTEGKSKVEAFAESRIGGRPENQDSFGWCDTKYGYLVTVCDGMGGGPGGKTASTIAVETILKSVQEASDEDTLSNILIKAIRLANLAILDTGKEHPHLRGMGSTCTLLLVNEVCAYIAHVGDSRVYQIRGSKKVFRTFDHSLVFEMVSQGVITEEQARLSAQSNIVTRALGVRPDVDVELHKVPYERGDRFVLCSDGIHGTMPEPELIKLISSHKHRLGVLTDDIATYVDNLGHNSGGGHDNLTLAIVETKTNSKLKPEMPRNAKLMLLGLAALLVISVVLNIVLACGGKGDAPTQNVNSDSIMTAKSDSTIKVLNDSIKKLSGELTQLQETAKPAEDAKK